jgi:ATP-dependent Clp protease ATP-binding subunit ClpX
MFCFVVVKNLKTSFLLIAGLDAHICDRCIEQRNGIVVEEALHTNTI